MAVTELEKKVAEFLSNVEFEHAHAITKFPNSHFSHAALIEEVGELATALMEECSQNVYAEAIQVASMAMRIACEGDSSFDEFRKNRKLDPIITCSVEGFPHEQQPDL